MKKLLFGAAFAAAAILTACDSDDTSTSGGSSSVGSCDVSTTMTMMGVTISTHRCGESSNAVAMKAECDSIKADFEAPAVDDYGFEEGDAEFDIDFGGEVDATVKYGSGCPSGYKKKCSDEDGTVVYFYDSGVEKYSCEDLLADDEEEDDYGFTPADDEFYMKALKKSAKKAAKK